MGKERVLLVGSGGREYATALKLLESPALHELVVVPGNDGVEYILGRQDRRVRRVSATQQADLVSFARGKRAIGEPFSFAIVGPESPLIAGITNRLESVGTWVLGPDQKGAQMEGSKSYAKRVFTQLKIPTATPWAAFANPEQAKAHVRTLKHQVVVKADGEAAGKGVFVCDDVADALAAIDICMVERRFGVAGDKVVVEKRLCGMEFSFIFLTDGKTLLPLPVARDYKRRFDEDQGPNTGGMGAYAPNEYVTPVLYEKIMNRIALPLINGLREVYKIDYKGFMYIGGMAVEEKHEINPYVLETNVRGGDPETQVQLPFFNVDFVEVGRLARERRLEEVKFVRQPDEHCVCVVLVSGKGPKPDGGWYEGYPGNYATGVPIFGLENVGVGNDAHVIHAGTRFNPTEKRWETNGGRVLGVVAKGKTLEDARRTAYQESGKIIFGGNASRRDIGR